MSIPFTLEYHLGYQRMKRRPPYQRRVLWARIEHKNQPKPRQNSHPFVSYHELLMIPCGVMQQGSIDLVAGCRFYPAIIPCCYATAACLPMNMMLASVTTCRQSRVCARSHVNHPLSWRRSSFSCMLLPIVHVTSRCIDIKVIQ